jgi:(p)ppGpp synthase/HD superfamily hydrolase
MKSTDPTTAAWFAAEKHRGQKYGNQPYTYHLEEAARQLDSYILTLPGMRFFDHDIIRSAVYLHDVIEDTGTSAYELNQLFDGRVVELVEAVTDGPGETRAEKKAPMYIKVRKIGIAAVAVKLADRLANALACGLSKQGSKMLETYREEQGEFTAKLYTPDGSALDPAWTRLRAYLGYS